MGIEDELKADEFLNGELEIESAVAGTRQYVRDQDGVWRYADNWIEVPGARDMTLTERFSPKFVVSNPADPEQGIERVVVSGSDVEANPQLLGWCLDAGVQVPEGEGPLREVFVPFDAWQEHDRIPGEIVAPENSENEVERELAAVEREYREADHELELAAMRRAEVLQRYADRMTRQEARAITGLSVGRIQQLIRSERLGSYERKVLELFEGGPISTFAHIHELARGRGLPGGVGRLSTQLGELEGRGLLATDPTKGLRLTQEGKQLLYVAKYGAGDDAGE